MSRLGEIVRPWGDGEYAFWLGVEGWRAIKEKCGVGPPVIARRLAPISLFHASVAAHIAQGKTEAERLALQAEVLSRAIASGLLGDWEIDDVREVIYQGLMGAGMDKTQAGLLVRRNVDLRPTDVDNVLLAFAIACAGYFAPEGESLGEPEAAKTRTRKTRTTTSASPPSTATAP